MCIHVFSILVVNLSRNSRKIVFTLTFDPVVHVIILSVHSIISYCIVNTSQLTMSLACRSKYNCLLSDSGRHWHPPLPPAHKNGTFTMFILLKLLILLTISFLTNILLNYAVYFSIFLGGCMAASTL